MGILGSELYPIRIGENQVVNLEKNGKIENQEVFKAVLNGYQIDLSMLKNKRGESNFIDLEWKIIVWFLKQVLI